MSKAKTPSRKELLYIDDINAAMLQRSTRRSRLVVYLVCLFFAAILGWAYYAELDEVTVGSGKVIPSQQLQVIQNLEGGIVKEVFVREGQNVERGEQLLRIDDTRFASDFRERAQKLNDLIGDLARQNALLESVVVDSSIEDSQWKQQVRIEEVDLESQPQFAQLSELEKSRQLSQLATEQRRLRNALFIADQTIDSKHQEIIEQESRVSHFQRSLNLVSQELSITAPLADEGVVSKVDVLKLRRQANELRSELESVKLLLPKLSNELSGAIFQRQDLALSYLSETQIARSLTQAELSSLTEGQAGLKDRVERTVVESPVAGTVKKIFTNTVGGVVQPGMSLMEIVPTEDNLLIEAKIQPKDIAFLRPGLHTVVKFSAYDFSIYGGLDGTLEHISADTIVDEEGNSFYLVRVRTEQSELSKGEQKLPIIPGMLSSVDIITGKKTVLDYLLKPILKAKQNALRER
ncbi:HlyD family type I secretion periplasmic adaptor subunit [Alginatibacterium sediminis]|uniref:Membrane fusion protein (MFP) family protein n=1 Tax=Alginatibacterium sediminis TaxID=2164068 RepID=A0A420E5H1_9ALTE|nr:HlyD family type I secretion periplasmic adaptor subunit [Alginatibacterium sediminis]RKF12823.1 HlyD family type I secretion periplasmic adaptor subunit [Alginatibacterium sediminis]